MKVGRLSPSWLCALYVVGVLCTIFAAATPAHAAGEDYLFYYPKDKVKEIGDSLTALKGNALSTPAEAGLNETAVWAKDGEYGKQPVPFLVDTAATKLEKQPGGSSKVVVYTYSKTCNWTYNAPNGFNVPVNDTINLIMRVTLTSNWSNEQRYTGKLSFTNSADQAAVSGHKWDISEKDVPASCLPSNLKNGPQTLSGGNGIASYRQMTGDAREAWPGVGTSASVKAAVNDTANKPEQTDSENADACAESALGFGWVVCPIIQMINGVVESTFQPLVRSMLHVDPLNGTGEQQGIYDVWNNFRTLANALLVVVFLVLIFANMVTL